ncbi:MAG: UDP-2,3-diacylglucosamine diphosphatase [Gammaproteobacteria bacterium]|nr:UDP-2,3-diacylglucosamine diphosphatase [Gammaproteobacteria bacterium]
MSTWFASDLHLDPATPEIADRFLRFLAGPIQGAAALYLLGDIFEAWLGDDDPEPAHRDVVAKLASITARGTLLFLMHGNRDFLLGERFCAETGATLLDDPVIATIGAQRVLLSHGDGLCVDDGAYQRLRALVRDPDVRRGFTALPLASRRRLATEARAGSRKHLAAAGAYITDVNQAAVETLMRAACVCTMIHGHTHRPALHRFDIEGVEYTRIVLGAWHATSSVLRWDSTGYHLLPCPV